MRPAPPVAPAIARPLPAEILSEAQRRLAALHPFYRKGLSADDAARLTSWSNRPWGRWTTSSSSATASSAIAEPVRLGAGRVRIQDRGARGRPRPGPDDGHRVFKDGRKVKGQVEEETDEYVRLKGRFGAIRSPKSEILRIDRGDPFAVEFRRRTTRRAARLSELPSVIAWCREKNLTQHRDLAAYAS
jgi:hypothetical protein